ncbi:RNA polymerase sigma factor [candidate division KSB1 bacterium]|nr:RNA polymerase sigma factor [candidate division KSB1 bacterium]
MSERHFIAQLDPIRPQLLAFCRHSLWKSALLEDVLQEILLTAFEKYDSFEQGTDFRAWIFQIASFVVFNVNRKFTREKLLLVPEPIEELNIEAELRDATRQEDWLSDAPDLSLHFSDDVSAAVKSLTLSERSVLLLRIVAGLSIADTASVLSMPQGSVMGFFSRAKRKVRVQLATRDREGGGTL